MPRKKKENLPAPQPERELTPVEQERVAEFKARRKAAPPAPKVKLHQTLPDGNALLSPEDPGAVFYEGLSRATGTLDADLAMKRVNQVINASSAERVATAAATNAALAAMAGAAPRDEVEGMLVAQMIAVHDVAMGRLTGLLRPGQPPLGVDMSINQAAKLLRTFTAQVETLNKYRRGGEQKVTVEHVHVHSGGQAIVGTINNQGGTGDGRESSGSKTGQRVLDGDDAIPVRLADGEEVFCPVQGDGPTVPPASDEER